MTKFGNFFEYFSKMFLKNKMKESTLDKNIRPEKECFQKHMVIHPSIHPSEIIYKAEFYQAEDQNFSARTRQMKNIRMKPEKCLFFPLVCQLTSAHPLGWFVKQEIGFCLFKLIFAPSLTTAKD